MAKEPPGYTGKDKHGKWFARVFPGAKILTAEKGRSHPDSIGVEVYYRDDWLQIQPHGHGRRSIAYKSHAIWSV
jgi:hypothetical protein